MKSLNKKKPTKEQTAAQKPSSNGPAVIDPRILHAALYGVDEPAGALAGRK
ncbi:hypothetical protein HZF02_07795 [Pseudomonas yamanorum]|nr:hypothetical protein HZF02_07795 [Pseudomonas yamanorum]